MNTGKTHEGRAARLPCIVSGSGQRLTSNRETEISVKNPRTHSSEEAEDRAQGSTTTGLHREDFRRDPGGEAWIYVQLCIYLPSFFSDSLFTSLHARKVYVSPPKSVFVFLSLAFMDTSGVAKR